MRFWTRREMEAASRAELARKCQDLDAQLYGCKKMIEDYRAANERMHNMILQIRTHTNAFDTPHAPTDQQIVDCILSKFTPNYGKSMMQELLDGIDRKILQENRDLRAKLEELQKPKNEAGPAKSSEASATSMLRIAKEIIAWEETKVQPSATMHYMSMAGAELVKVSDCLRWLVGRIEFLEAAETAYNEDIGTQKAEIQKLKAIINNLNQERADILAAKEIHFKMPEIPETELLLHFQRMLQESHVEAYKLREGLSIKERDIRALHIEVDRLKSQLTAGK